MKITYDQIKSLSQRHEYESIGMTNDYESTIPNFINEYRYKVSDLSTIMRTLCRHDFMTDKELILFAVRSCRQVQHIMKDEGSLKALDAADDYVKGIFSSTELDCITQSSWSVVESTKLSSKTKRSKWLAALSVYKLIKLINLSGVGFRFFNITTVTNLAVDSACFLVAESGGSMKSVRFLQDGYLNEQIDYLLDLFERKNNESQ